MSRAQAHLNTALAIVDKYKGEMPLAAWLRQYFSANKKHGSRDRKEISHLCYAFFRLGKAFPERTWEERMHIALLLCQPHHPSLIASLIPEWTDLVSLPLKEQLAALKEEDAVQTIFPFNDFLSEAIDRDAFNISMLTQPDLFLRLRPGRGEVVCGQLDEAGIDYVKESDTTLRLTNQAKLEAFIHPDRDAVIQDLNSQRVLNMLEPKMPVKAMWDCCAASGGKTLLAYDQLKVGDITVTDIRESILHNLRSRFERAGIRKYHSFTADLSRAPLSTDQRFDLIICDAPCSGSGTWSRTPEQLRNFNSAQIDTYAALQKKIAVNAAKSLASGGSFIYITCSVFKKENEEVVAYLENESKMKLKEMNYLKGYDKRADTLFVALFNL